MNFAAHCFLTLFMAVNLCTICGAHPEFKLRIPNGDAYLRDFSGINCEQLGHEPCKPGAPRNPFGLDFLDAGLKWTKELCEKDSDGDGLSNGEELGDPCCIWSELAPTPLRQFMLSHPGAKADNGADLAPGCGEEGDDDGEVLIPVEISTAPPITSIILPATTTMTTTATTATTATTTTTTTTATTTTMATTATTASTTATASTLTTKSPTTMVATPTTKSPTTTASMEAPTTTASTEAPTTTASTEAPTTTTLTEAPTMTAATEEPTTTTTKIPTTATIEMTTTTTGMTVTTLTSATTEVVEATDVPGTPVPPTTAIPLTSVTTTTALTEASTGTPAQGTDPIALPSPTTPPTVTPDPSPSSSSSGDGGSGSDETQSPSEGLEEGGQAPAEDESGSGDTDNSSDDNTDSACFPSHSTVRLINRQTKTMRDLQIGDRVHIGGGKYSPIFLFTHRLEHVWHEFVTLRVKSRLGTEAVLSLSKGHFLYVNDKVLPAESVRVGDELEFDDGERGIVEEISCAQHKGLYNPQTEDGDLVVNSVRVSSYTTAVDIGAAHALLVPVRVMHRLAGWTTVSLEGGADRIAAMLP